MKKIIRSLAVLLSFTSMHNVHAQKQEKIYYDYAWGLTTSDQASYYRLVNFDKNNKVVGFVRNYYMSGKLQFEGEALSIDRVNIDSSKYKNKTTGYYKNGNKEYEKNYDAFGNLDGPTKSWDNDGVLKYTFYFNDEDLFNLEIMMLQHNIDDLMSIQDSRILDVNVTIKRTKDRMGTNIFEVYRKKNLVSKWIYSIDAKFVRAEELLVVDVTNAEKELSQKGFLVISSKSVDATASEDPLIIKKWGRDDYPFRFITLQYSGKIIKRGIIHFVSKLSSFY
jgi:hypothetical protein